VDAKEFGRARRWARYPIYIPQEGWKSLSILAEGGPNAFRAELESLHSLGSSWAAAVLGHLHLTAEAGAGAKAVEVCRSAADRGYAYAQYVLAWALVDAGDQSEALRYLSLASLQGFSPATVDLGQFVCRGMGTTGPDPKSAVGLLRLAIKRGHRGAFARICYVYRHCDLGLTRKTIGLVLGPVAHLGYVLSVWRNPFDVRVYLLVRSMGTPFVAPINKNVDGRSRPVA
jgi:TPR repeat protein